MRSNTPWGRVELVCMTVLLTAGLATPGKAMQATATATRPSTSAPAATSFKPEELEQLLAPIALYPDSLLAQILMASTYPLEVVQAERAVKANPGLKDDAAALNKLTYDPSVKSLINFPQVLTMMSEKLDWTVKLGDAFLADQKSVMDAVQKLRAKAYAQGNLKTTSEQKVTVQPTTQPAAAGQAPAQVYVVESTSPSVVYVPTYNPTVVYGGWPYPAYPPAYYYPPGYVAGTALVSFGVGMAVGAAWGHAWGDSDWDGGDVNIDVDKNFNFNQNIDRDKVKAEYNKRNQGQGTGNGRGQGQFKHDPSHRQGVSYRDQATNNKYRGSAGDQARVQSREAYRGRADAGRQDLNGGGAGVANRAGGTGGRTGSQDYQRNAGGRQNSSNRSASGGRSSGFGGVNSGRSGATAASNRGQASRSGGYSGGGRAAPRGGGGRAGGGRGGRR
jgi:hypothetical protein